MAHSFSIFDSSAFSASLYFWSASPAVALRTRSVTSVMATSWLTSISGHFSSSATVLAV